MHQETKSYISFLASQTGTDISKWNLPEIFGKSKSKMDKAKVNKFFFAARDLASRASPPATDQLANVSKEISTRTKSSSRVVMALENKIKHFHHISTDEVFGALDLSQKRKFNEDTIYNPTSPYAASKAAAASRLI